MMKELMPSAVLLKALINRENKMIEKIKQIDDHIDLLKMQSEELEVIALKNLYRQGKDSLSEGNRDSNVYRTGKTQQRNRR